MEAFWIPVLNYPSGSNGQWARRAAAERAGGLSMQSAARKIREGGNQQRGNVWQLVELVQNEIVSKNHEIGGR